MQCVCVGAQGALWLQNNHSSSRGRGSGSGNYRKQPTGFGLKLVPEKDQRKLATELQLTAHMFAVSCSRLVYMIEQKVIKVKAGGKWVDGTYVAYDLLAIKEKTDKANMF